MVSNVRVNAAMVQVRSIKPAKSFGQLARVDIATGAYGLVRAPISTDIPTRAIFSDGKMWFCTAEAISGTHTFKLQFLGGMFKDTTTWNDMPALSGTRPEISVTKTDLAANEWISFDVTSDIDAVVSLTNLPNRGWRFWSSTLGVGKAFHGATAEDDQPYLAFTWRAKPKIPFDLHPESGVIGTPTPRLQWRTMYGMTHANIQADTGNGSIWDSGWVDVDSPAFALATSTFTGFVNGDTDAKWRVRVKNGAGESGWSPWATPVYKPLPTVTITSPGATTGDPDPTIDWTAPAQVAREVQYRRHSDGALLARGRRAKTTVTDWTAPEQQGRPLYPLRVGQEADAIVRVWDAEHRVAVAGFPEYGEAVHTFTLVRPGNHPAPTTFTATQTRGRPWVDLAWGGNLAEGYQLERGNGQILRRFETAVQSWRDWDAVPWKSNTYRVHPIVSGIVSNNYAQVTIEPNPQGIWLYNEDTDASAVIFRQDENKASMPEQIVRHEVLGNGGDVFRRRGLKPPTGTITGGLYDALGKTADENYEFLMRAKARRLDYEYRLYLGSWVIPVTLTGIDVWPSVQTSAENGRVYDVSLTWQQVDGSTMPWEDLD